MIPAPLVLLLVALALVVGCVLGIVGERLRRERMLAGLAMTVRHWPGCNERCFEGTHYLAADMAGGEE